MSALSDNNYVTVFFSGFPPLRAEVLFKIRKTAFLSMAIRSYRDRAMVTHQCSMVFLYKNHKIKPGDTPESLGMRNNDLVEVHEEKTFVAYVKKFKDRHLKQPKQTRKMMEDLSDLMERTESSDFTITTSCDGKRFPVHKLIVTARSSVFRAMLDTEMLESARREIVIPDIDSGTVKEMIRFIYSGELSDSQLDLQAIWHAADKYDVNGLKDAIFSKMKNEMASGVNIADMFIIRHDFIFLTLLGSFFSLYFLTQRIVVNEICNCSNRHGNEHVKKIAMKKLKENPSVLEDKDFKERMSEESAATFSLLHDLSKLAFQDANEVVVL